MSEADGQNEQQQRQQEPGEEVTEDQSNCSKGFEYSAEADDAELPQNDSSHSVCQQDVGDNQEQQQEHQDQQQQLEADAPTTVVDGDGHAVADDVDDRQSADDKQLSSIVDNNQSSDGAADPTNTEAGDSSQQRPQSDLDSVHQSGDTQTPPSSSAESEVSTCFANGVHQTDARETTSRTQSESVNENTVELGAVEEDHQTVARDSTIDEQRATPESIPAVNEADITTVCNNPLRKHSDDVEIIVTCYQQPQQQQLETSSNKINLTTSCLDDQRQISPQFIAAESSSQSNGNIDLLPIDAQNLSHSVTADNSDSETTTDTATDPRQTIVQFTSDVSTASAAFVSEVGPCECQPQQQQQQQLYVRVDRRDEPILLRDIFWPSTMNDNADGLLMLIAVVIVAAFVLMATEGAVGCTWFLGGISLSSCLLFWLYDL